MSGNLANASFLACLRLPEPSYSALHLNLAMTRSLATLLPALPVIPRVSFSHCCSFLCWAYHDLSAVLLCQAPD